MAGCHRVAVPLVAGRPRFRDRRRRAARRRHPAHPRADRQLAAQPDGHGRHRRRVVGDRRARRRARPAGDHRRGVRAAGVRRAAPPPAGRLPGHGRADDHHLERGEDVQRHRLEDRLGLRPSRSHRRRARGQAVPDLRRRRAVPARRRRRRSTPRTPGSPTLRESFQAKRDSLAGALTDIGFDVHDSFGTYFLCADPRPLGYTDSTTFCAELPERAGVAAIPMSAFCDPDSATSATGITWCASPSANATRPWTRRSAASGAQDLARRALTSTRRPPRPVAGSADSSAAGSAPGRWHRRRGSAATASRTASADPTAARSADRCRRLRARSPSGTTGWSRRTPIASAATARPASTSSVTSTGHRRDDPRRGPPAAVGGVRDGRHDELLEVRGPAR